MEQLRAHDDAHEVGDRARVGLVHDGGSVGFDGLDGDAEVVGDLLVETAVDDALENLLLARRELGEQGFIETAAFLLHVAFTGFAEHALDELLEGGLLEGFFDEVDGAALEGVHGHGHVSVAR